MECELGNEITVGEIITELNKKAYSSQMIPVNGIIMYYGFETDLPNNWVICDGNNGTEDLKDLFIQGTTQESEIGTTGGYKDTILPEHTHNTSTDNIGSHYHTGSLTSGGNHSHTGSAASGGDHSHNMVNTNCADSSNCDSLWWNTNASSGGNGLVLLNSSVSTSVGGGSHSHTLTINSDGEHTHTGTLNDSGEHTHETTIENTGESGIDKNLPPFINLIYIKKISEVSRVSESSLYKNNKNFSCDPSDTHEVSDIIADINLRADLEEQAPIKGILPYSGSFSNIPDNWALCDGSNETPDISNLFIKGSDSSELGTTGGYNTVVVSEHTHVINLDNSGIHSHIMTIDSSGIHGHSASLDGNVSHSHTGFDWNTAAWFVSNAGGYGGWWVLDNEVTDYNVYGGDHTHSVTINAAGYHTHISSVVNNGIHTHTLNINNSGIPEESNNNYPEYYKLAYIMRVS